MERKWRLQRVALFSALVLAVVALPHAVHAFDGHRRGFVLGGGIGGGRYSDDGAVLSTDLRIGYGVSDQILMSYSGLAYAELAFEGDTNSGLLLTIRGTYYLSDHSPSLMVSGGMGPAIASLSSGVDPDPVPAPYLGVGFEFPKHMSLQYDLICLPFAHTDWVSVVRLNILMY